jgi:hypothetical protein
MSADTTKKAESKNRMLEYAVPVLGFSGAFLGLFIRMNALPVDIRITILGCLLSSCALAYLAWIRPRKDIVALTTPLYSIIFLGFPLDDVATIVLEFLYAASLTALLVRLRNRFGESGSLVMDKAELAEPISRYMERIPDVLKNVSQESGHAAALVVTRFARGDFHDAALTAEAEIAKLNDARAPRIVQEAFAIVREQAEHLDKSFPAPERFVTFSSDAHSMLVKEPVSPGDKNDLYNSTLENALVLLFACAWAASEQSRSDLLNQEGFVLQLLS